jgi:hypothetical protein
MFICGKLMGTGTPYSPEAMQYLVICDSLLVADDQVTLNNSEILSPFTCIFTT